MSQSIVINQSDPTIPKSEKAIRRSELDDFNYIPVTPLAPITCFFGLASALALVAWQCLALAVAGLIVGLIALVRIRQAKGALGGLTLASIGLVASLVFLIAGIGRHAHAYATEVPEDHRRVNFPREIAAKEFVYRDDRRELHPDVVPLVGQKVFLKGWMYQSKVSTNLTRFLLLKDSGKCCFGGDPKPFHMIGVVMADNLTTSQYSGMISVAGVLEADPDAPPGDPVYTLTATQCGPARTAF